jgi:hypothetical protein
MVIGDIHKEMKFVFLLLMSNITFFLFPQGTDIVERLWGNCKSPTLTRIKYSGNERELKISCADGLEIIVHFRDGNDRQLIEVTRCKKTLFSFFSNYIINFRYLSDVYKVELSPVSYAILLVAYPEGASGLSANMTFGVLFDIDNCRYQYLSTWGMVDKNFVDINSDGIYEFVSVDYNVSNNELKLIANVFVPDFAGQYSINNSFINNDVYVFFFKDMKIKRIRWKQTDIEIMKMPDIFERNDKYYQKS